MPGKGVIPACGSAPYLSRQGEVVMIVMSVCSKADPWSGSNCRHGSTKVRPSGPDSASQNLQDEATL